jgi:hypothetical protein
MGALQGIGKVYDDATNGIKDVVKNPYQLASRGAAALGIAGAEAATQNIAKGIGGAVLKRAIDPVSSTLLFPQTANAINDVDKIKGWKK